MHRRLSLKRKRPVFWSSCSELRVQEWESACECVCMQSGSPFFFSECLSAGAVSCWLLAPLHAPHREEKERKLLLSQSEINNIIHNLYIFILLHTILVFAQIKTLCVNVTSLQWFKNIFYKLRTKWRKKHQQVHLLLLLCTQFGWGRTSLKCFVYFFNWEKVKFFPIRRCGVGSPESSEKDREKVITS